MPKILVIGSNSFSGSSFIKFILEKSYFDTNDIFAISRSDEQISPLNPSKWPNKEFNFFRFHLVDDINEIIAKVNQIKPNFIVNFAAQSMVAQSWDSPEDWFETNCVATVKLHNYLRNSDYLERYIHISTPEVYGNCNGSVNEDCKFDPTTPYAVSRAASDMSLKIFFEAYQFPVITTRAANVFGPGQSLYRIIPKTILSIMKNEKLKLHGGGVSKRSFIHIDDVSSATYLLMKKGKEGETYHISTEELISIKSLVEKICSFMNVDFDKHVDIDKERLGKDMVYDLDSSKIKKALSWYPKISLDDGIKQTISWIEENFDILKDESDVYQHKR